ncbi:MAG: hypothetical protein GYB21_10780 [Oceanospirillales bacterium]|nr:hypothetical protein [Oceanospirillales bacterium]
MFTLKRTLLAVGCALAFSAPAFASHCPADAKAIDGAMSKVQLSDEQRSAIQALRDEGMKQHAAGDHRGAESTLAKAMRMLLDDMAMQ